MSVAVAYVLALGVMAISAREVDQFPGETAVADWAQSLRAGWLDVVADVISIPGYWAVGLPLVATTMVVLVVLGKRRESLLVLWAMLSSSAVIAAMKSFVARSRPPWEIEEAFGIAQGYSFPSGHVVHYVVFLGTLMLLATQYRTPGVAPLVWCLGLISMLAVGFSRVYLGAHWLGDILAGYAVGAGVLAAIWICWWHWVRQDDVSHADTALGPRLVSRVDAD